MIDLHVHSTRSDGSYTPSQLVDYAMEKGLTAFALTDHDTVEGLDEAYGRLEELRSQGVPEERLPELIPGIELSTDRNGQEVHVVGLYIDHRHPSVQSYLADFLASRDNRNRKMCEKLAECGFPVPYEALLERFPDAVLTRAHYARYMLEQGYVQSIREAFDRFLSDRAPCYVPREKITPFQAVEFVLQAGGIPVLAHPILYHLSDRKLEDLVREMKDAGLIGIEAIYSTYSPAEERQIRRLAEKYHLRISGGSDFHGANKPGLDLGTGYGKLHVPDEVLTGLQEALKSKPQMQ